MKKKGLIFDLLVMCSIFLFGCASLPSNSNQKSDVTTAIYTLDGNYLILGAGGQGKSASIGKFDAATGKLIIKFDVPKNFGIHSSSFVLSQDGQQLLVDCYNNAGYPNDYIYDVNTGMLIDSFPNRSGYYRATQDGFVSVSVSANLRNGDFTATTIGLGTGETIKQITIPDVFKGGISEEGDYYLSASLKKVAYIGYAKKDENSTWYIFVFDIDKGELDIVLPFLMVENQSYITDVAFSNDDEYLGLGLSCDVVTREERNRLAAQAQEALDQAYFYGADWLYSRANNLMYNGDFEIYMKAAIKIFDINSNDLIASVVDSGLGYSHDNRQTNGLQFNFDSTTLYGLGPSRILIGRKGSGGRWSFSASNPIVRPGDVWNGDKYSGKQDDTRRFLCFTPDGNLCVYLRNKIFIIPKDSR